MKQPAQPSQSLKQFSILLGKWSMVGTHPGLPSTVHGNATFEWLVEGALLAWHFEWERGGPPSGFSVMGRDDTMETCYVLYSDERGVTRIYQTSIEDGVWKMWRDAPGFFQRMTGTFSDDGNTITWHGELLRDGSTWEQDLDVIYTRMQS